MESSRHPFRADLRRKFKLPCLDEIKAFAAYPCNLDQWEDAKMSEVFDYIWSYRNLRIPEAWLPAMTMFREEYMEVRKKVP